MGKRFVLSVLFLLCLFPVCAGNEDYHSVFQSFHERLFGSGKIEYDQVDLREVEKLYALASDLAGYARVQYLEALARFYALVPDYGKASSPVDRAMAVLTEKKAPGDYGKLALLKGMLARRYQFEYGRTAYKQNMSYMR